MDGETYLQSMELRLDNGKIVGAGESDRMRDRLVKEKWAQLYSVGWEECTVVNCLSWPLDLLTGFGTFRVQPPDKKKGEMFRTWTIKVPSIDMKDLGEGRYVPDVVMPVEIAREFARKYEEEGGVFWFKGEVIPADVGERLKECHEKMMVWMKRKYGDAQGNWARYNKNPYFIDDRMRDAAYFLFERGQLPQGLPEWVTATRDEAVTHECAACGEIVKRTAKVCVHCGYAIDPEFAKQNAGRLGAKAQAVQVASAPVEVAEVDLIEPTEKPRKKN